MSHQEHSFYCCYLIQSKKTASSRSLYIGSTPNPIRRLRQHNGEIQGGAWKTRNGRPWIILCLVHGFPNKTSALQFEWIWQHPNISRHTKNKEESVKKTLSLNSSLVALQQIVSCNCWKRWPLEITFFSQQAFEKWNAISKGNTSVKFSMEEREIMDFYNKVSEVELIKFPSKNKVNRKSICDICLRGLHEGDSLLYCLYDDCDMTSHTTCLATHYLESEEHILPVMGRCILCLRNLQWSKLIKTIQNMKRDDNDIDNQTSSQE
ncbi:structure-specific endonuclease catalytic subunit Slx1 [Schizosaccharomyces osmophilus]|uniref:Structure-specific endonuclease catalytic subunit Slx1 n=1 Tax=Schizosaccharomyces osmophilus TaxID=2545709 RepID=A0AAE9W6S7_9SCHI|nr:structure-specific endonuclease catalytic subunit Slx1 [Schizosaccharomyces osmophilus]WBW71032.1 structure-specific endonuclease catalytic subunit Slx1 [Schizosaccharomyces osmophilus]